MSYDNQLARRLAVHNKARRAARVKRPMRLVSEWEPEGGLRWYVLGTYGQALGNFRLPSMAKQFMRRAQNYTRKYPPQAAVYIAPPEHSPPGCVRG